MRHGFDGVRIVIGERDDHPSDVYSGANLKVRVADMSVEVVAVLILWSVAPVVISVDLIRAA